MTSPDAVNWVNPSAAEANQWRDVLFSNNIFVACSVNGTNRVMTSPDGITWTARSVTAGSWNSVAFGRGLFVIVGDSVLNSVFTSPDGITWTERALTTSNNWNGVAYGNGRFVAVASSGTDRVMYSIDGINWTQLTPPEDSAWLDIAYGNGLFVAVASSGTNQIMTSPDGINWTLRDQPSNDDWGSITYGDGVFVAVAFTGTKTMYSIDGIVWTQLAATEANQWRGITYKTGEFVAVSSNGTNRVMTLSYTSQYNFYSEYVVGDISTGCYRMIIHDENDQIKYLSNPIKFTDTIAPWSYLVKYRNNQNILNFNYTGLIDFYNQFRIDLFIRQPTFPTNRIGYELISGSFNAVRSVKGTKKQFLTEAYSAEDHEAFTAATVHSDFQVFENGEWVSYTRSTDEQVIEWQENFPLADGTINLERIDTFSSSDNV